MDLDQWEFYLLPTERLNERAPTGKALSLRALLTMDPVRASYEELPGAVCRLEDELLPKTA